MSRVKRYGNNISGVLLLDKDPSISSNLALQKVKRLFQADKAGHTGSLDPLATGMLPICLGEATKFSQFLLDADKSYLVTIKLGSNTDSGDSDGNILTTNSVPELHKESLEKILDKFRGTITQVPPMHSALKYQGQPLYKLARQGIEIDRKKRIVTIKSLEIINYDSINNILIMDVTCSKGTYMRTLAIDIGVAIGCGAHVIGLRRLSLGPYQRECKIYKFVNLSKNNTNVLLPVTSILGSIQILKVTQHDAINLYHGKKIIISNVDLVGLVQLYYENNFLGVGEVEAPGIIRSKRLMTSKS